MKSQLKTKLKLLIRMILLVVLYFFLLQHSSKAQQTFQFSQFQFNEYVINPAAAGRFDELDIQQGNRKQWFGIDESPMTFYASLTTPLGKRRSPRFNSIRDRKNYYENNREGLHHALGAIVMNDIFGAFTSTKLQFSYAINMPLINDWRLSMGPRIGAANSSINTQKIALKDPNDPTYFYYLSDGDRNFHFDSDFGIQLYNYNFKIGYAALQLIPTNITAVAVNNDAKRLLHHFVSASYDIILNEKMDFQSYLPKNIILRPSVLMRKTANSPFSIDYSMILDFQGAVLLGTAYRTGNTFVFYAGIYFGNNSNFIISYDLPTALISKSTFGTLEATLKLSLRPKKRF